MEKFVKKGLVVHVFEDEEQEGEYSYWTSFRVPSHLLELSHCLVSTIAA